MFKKIAFSALLVSLSFASYALAGIDTHITVTSDRYARAPHNYIIEPHIVERLTFESSRDYNLNVVFYETFFCDDDGNRLYRHYEKRSYYEDGSIESIYLIFQIIQTGEEIHIWIVEPQN